MAYIGNEPSVNFTSFAKQDITGDGTANYTLTYAVANANEIEVFVNSVRQEPTEAYTVSGTALSMTGNVASTDDFYVIYLGKALQTTVPPDGSVSTAKIADDAVTSAKLDTNIAIDGTLDVTGEITESGKEYFHVDLTTDQSGTDGSSSVVDLGGSGTVVYDSKSNFDSTNDAYLLGSSDGVYLISFSIGIATDSITSEAIIYARGGVQVATDGSTFSDLKGSGQQMRNSDGDNGGSVVLSGSFIYKATTSTTKIRMLVLAELTGTPDHIIVSSVEELTQSVTALADARPTWLTVVRIA